VADKDRTTIGTSEISMRNQYRAWERYMTASMEGDAQ